MYMYIIHIYIYMHTYVQARSFCLRDDRSKKKLSLKKKGEKTV